MLESSEPHYAKLGLAYNPFEVLTNKDFVSIFPISQDVFAVLKNGTEKLLQVIGPSGYGKTSLLLQILHYYENKSENVYYKHIGIAGERLDPACIDSDVLIIDEAWRIENVCLQELLILRLKGNKLTVVSSHEDIGKSLEFPFFVINIVRITDEMIADFFQRRIKAAMIMTGYPQVEKRRFSISSSSFGALRERNFEGFRGIRAILYEIFTWDSVPLAIEKKHILKAVKMMKEKN